MMKDDYKNENRPHNIFSRKAEGRSLDSRSGRFCWHWFHGDQENEYDVEMSFSIPDNGENQPRWKFVQYSSPKYSQITLGTPCSYGIGYSMNYLHKCFPPIIHCDLKSLNLLVDKNWTVKIGDFGLCRIKHEAYVTKKEEIETPEWTAPEVLRDEKANEKSDVYSYGVVLWEITTEKIPWDGLKKLQIMKAVGYMNQRLDIPKDVDPQWASLIEMFMQLNWCLLAFYVGVWDDENWEYLRIYSLQISFQKKTVIDQIITLSTCTCSTFKDKLFDQKRQERCDLKN
nr:PAS domain-containing protein tyrosine kinase family protein [Tanacetum cinerariifolium]